MSSTWSTTKLRGNWLRHLQGPLGARTRKLPLHRELPDTSSTKTRSAGCSKNSGQDISRAALELLITMNNWIGEKLELEFQEERCEFDSPCSLLLGCFVVWLWNSTADLAYRRGSNALDGILRLTCHWQVLWSERQRKWALWFVQVCWVGELQGFMVVTKWHKVRYTFNRKRYQCCSAQTWAEGKKQILWQRWISFLLNTTKHHDHTIVYHHFPCKKIGNGEANPPCLDKTQHHSVLVVSICIPSLSRHQMAGFIPPNLRYPAKKE